MIGPSDCRTATGDLEEPLGGLVVLQVDRGPRWDWKAGNVNHHKIESECRHRNDNERRLFGSCRWSPRSPLRQPGEDEHAAFAGIPYGIERVCGQVYAFRDKDAPNGIGTGRSDCDYPAGEGVILDFSFWRSGRVGFIAVPK